MNRDLLIQELIRDEGVRLVVYDDSTGKPLKIGDKLVGHPTCGVGRALDVRGITKDEALYLLGNDVNSITAELRAGLPYFDGLTDDRQRVLVNMGFNLGVVGLLGFHDTLRYVQEGRYELASKAMKDSHWYGQVGVRAERLVEMMFPQPK